MKYIKVNLLVEKSIFLPVETKEQAEKLLFDTELPNALRPDVPTMVILDALINELTDAVTGVTDDVANYIQYEQHEFEECA